MGSARDVASRVCFIHEGRILEEGPPAEIFAAPKEERARQFLQRTLPAGGREPARAGRPTGAARRGGCNGAARYRWIVLQDSHQLDVSLEPLDEYLVIQP